MTISEKKIELVQALLLLQDKATLFEIEKLIATAFKTQKNKSVTVAEMEVTFETWAAQFEALKHPDKEDEYGMTSTALRQRIWAAEQGRDMSLEEFFERVAQN